MSWNYTCSAATVGEMCASLRNYFALDPISGEFTIKDSEITVPGLVRGQYFRIDGSVFNDGVHRYGEIAMNGDETFTGTITPMAVPPAFEAVASEIEEWKQKNADVINSPYQSESFGGYSYTKGSASWQGVFAKRLNRWRKL